MKCPVTNRQCLLSTRCGHFKGCFHDSACMDCGNAPRKHNDPRTPPLDTKICLCDDCFIAASESAIEDLEEEASEARHQLARQLRMGY